MSQPEKIVIILSNCTTIPAIDGNEVNCSTILAQIEGIVNEGKMNFSNCFLLDIQKISSRIDMVGQA